MSANGLAAPGTSSYDSNTLTVGDGTWDSGRNTFLLPNLVGLNFETMRYNGMGNRFRDLPQYHVLITGHAVVAAITFLGVVPAAIFIARYWHTHGRWAYKFHVYLQILTVFLATVVLVLGWFAVGPERSLSNPHHGIGVAIYVLVLVQFIFGWWMSRRERKRTKPHPTIPLKVHLHRIFGRSLAILAIVQVALGLTLYGSPKVLFILYTLWVAFLIFAYLALEYRNKPRIGAGGPGPHSDYRSDYYSDYTGSYLSGSRTDVTRDRRGRSEEHSSWGKKLLAGAGAFGAYKWFQNRRDKGRGDRDDESSDSRSRIHRPESTLGPGDSTMTPTPYGRAQTPARRNSSRPPPAGGYSGQRPPSRGDRHRPVASESWDDSEVFDEKHNDRAAHTWRNRILGAGAGLAAFQGVKSLFGSKKRRNEGYVDSDVSYHRPPPGGNHNFVSQTDVSRVEAGQAPFSPDDPRRQHQSNMAGVTPVTPTRRPHGRQHSVDSFSEEASYASRPQGQSAGNGMGLKESMAVMGAIAGLKDWNRRRKDRIEDERQERLRREELAHEEQFNRRHSHRYPRPQDASGRRHSNSGTVMTGPSGPDQPGSMAQGSRQSFRPDLSHPPLPAAAGAVPFGSAPTAEPHPQPPYPQQAYPPQQQQQTQTQTQNTTVMFDLPPPPPGPPPNTVRPDYQPPPPGSLQMPQPAVNPDPSRLVSTQNSTHDFATGVATGAAAGYAAGHHRTHSESPSRHSHRDDSRPRPPRHGGGRRNSDTSATMSQANTGSIVPGASPPVAVKVNMHPDGRHVTLRRLNEEEAAAERAARRKERKSRRSSSLSSGGEEALAGTGRYRRGSVMRPSNQQPITNVPPPPPHGMSSSALNRPSPELNLPVLSAPSGSMQGYPPVAATGPAGSGAFGSPPGAGTDMGTGTDVSAFDNNRRRRRAERARRMEAARGGGGRVEFE
ncbi:unnamed protein product [Zymoseptoria tritici ST99CH_3D1]|uniref:Cytochrome b561 domain-containing protein n=1 Tax=Zymoseptoria tritici (strain ST99CH_3D7) TaxID=1276538 RepID=A0A1X7RRM8_ZYMT9|nr:unnamed protein product [Zymoseptoria tritici ST99CH_3D7]SMR51977.1 unnamed protein product [Zymoseptoria tritici ST99CH_3D1]